MIEKKTVIDQIEVTSDAHVNIRFAIQVVEGDHVFSSTWHRVSIEPGADVEAILDLVDADITARPELRATAMHRGRVPELKSICGIAHTPEVVKRHRDKVEAAQAKPAPSA
jgi:hypothetical protein